MQKKNEIESLTIVIPAYNEEDAIAATISRCLKARKEIECATGICQIEIMVVNDGSTDKTLEIARQYRDVKLVSFEKNQGYGAAIKEGFRKASGTLVSFLDADGTCNPLDFIRLCRELIDQNAQIALGSRLGPGTKMPAIRKLGNRFYAFLLGLLCGNKVTDTASGMRVIRKDALNLLYPLPDGLHFTPAMSSRALLNGLRVVEVPIYYEERVGTSKLRVVSDGMNFLESIFSGVLCYRPERLLGMIFTAFLLSGLLLAANPTEFYLKYDHFENWMIYRFFACSLLGSMAFFLLCAIALAHQMARFGPRQNKEEPFWPSLVSSFFEGKTLWFFIIFTTFVSITMLWPGIVEYLSSWYVNLHWSCVLVGCFGLLLAFQAGTTGILMRVLAIWQAQGKASLQQNSLQTENPTNSVSCPQAT